MQSTKEIQRRIKSIGNTKKITKAMEMVAASKMRRAVEAVLKTRSYANLSWTTVLNLVDAVNCDENLHPLLKTRKEIKSVGIILFSSNRGLCGGFNTAIINKAYDSVKKHQMKKGKEISKAEFVVVGKKGLAINSRYKLPVVAEFPKADIAYEANEVSPIARLIMDDFLSGKYDKIMVAYTDFISPSKQVPRVKQLLPIDLTAKEEHLGIVGEDTRIGIDKEFTEQKEDKYLRDKEHSYTFTFEPNPFEVLRQMLPRLIEIQLFQALLESNASEHSCRMAAMHQASEAAEDLTAELTLYYNKARQAAITSEIAEISAGANALKR